jgi:hypothetical protein
MSYCIIVTSFSVLPEPPAGKIKEKTRDKSLMISPTVRDEKQQQQQALRDREMRVSADSAPISRQNNGPSMMAGSSGRRVGAAAKEHENNATRDRDGRERSGSAADLKVSDMQLVMLRYSCRCSSRRRRRIYRPFRVPPPWRRLRRLLAIITIRATMPVTTGTTHRITTGKTACRTVRSRVALSQRTARFERR